MIDTASSGSAASSSPSHAEPDTATACRRTHLLVPAMIDSLPNPGARPHRLSAVPGRRSRTNPLWTITDAARAGTAIVGGEENGAEDE
ncbi:hypothetical protein GCM10023192_01400 [Amycolatopsis samaneae]